MGWGVRKVFSAAVVAVVATVAVGPAVCAYPAQRLRWSLLDVRLLATDVLIMTGTDMHSVDPTWVSLAVEDYITPTLGGQYTAIPLLTPAEFWPFGGLWDETLDGSVAEGTAVLTAAIAETRARHESEGSPDVPFVVFGYSQSAIIITAEKRRLAEITAQGQPTPPVSFVLLGNPGRPNGGIHARFPGLRLPGWTFSGATPTDTGFPTIDVARQYDPFADFPRYPLNPFALANTLIALFYEHDYGRASLDPHDPRFDPATIVQHYGDTTYYLIPAEHLPLLQPLRDLGLAPRLLDAVEPALRVLVELGYDRALPYGTPAPAGLSAPLDLPKLQSDLAEAVQEGFGLWEAARGSHADGLPSSRPTSRREPDGRSVALTPGGPALGPSVVENRHRAGQPGRGSVDLDRETGHLEAVRR